MIVLFDIVLLLAIIVVIKARPEGTKQPRLLHSTLPHFLVQVRTDLDEACRPNLGWTMFGRDDNLAGRRRKPHKDTSDLNSENLRKPILSQNLLEFTLKQVTSTRRCGATRFMG